MYRASLLLLLVLILTAGPLRAAEPPSTEVELLAPAAGAELSGAVEVRVQVTPPDGAGVPEPVCVGIGGAGWVMLQKAPEPAEWTGRIDTTMFPNGEHILKVITGDKRVSATVKVRLANPLRVFFADLHSHTGYSDGVLTPAIAHAYARDEAGLDVFSLTDHLELIDEGEWLDSRAVAFGANEEGAFVVIPGLEWTKQIGHVNIYDPKTRHWSSDLATFYEEIAAADVVVKFNHPGDGSGVFNGMAYSETADRAIQMMEVRFAQEEQAFIRALDNGWHIAPDGSDDTHAANWGNCGTWTGLLLPGLSRRNVWDAMKRRRLYSTRDRNCRLAFEIGGAVMGDIVEAPLTAVEVAVRVEDPDADDAVARIELFEDGNVVATDEPQAPRREWSTARQPQPGPHYYFVKIIQADGNTIWSAPIWVTVAGGEEGTPSPGSSVR